MSQRREGCKQETLKDTDSVLSYQSADKSPLLLRAFSEPALKSRSSSVAVGSVGLVPSISKQRAAADLAKVRLEHFIEEEKVKMQIKELRTKFQLQQLESKKALLQAQAELEKANILADVDSQDEDRIIAPEENSIPLQGHEKVSAYLNNASASSLLPPPGFSMTKPVGSVSLPLVSACPAATAVSS